LIFTLKDEYNLTTAIDKLCLHESIIRVFDAKVSNKTKLTAAKKLLSIDTLSDKTQYEKILTWMIENYNVEILSSSADSIYRDVFYLLTERLPENVLSSYGITLRTSGYEETGENGNILNYITYEVWYNGDKVAYKEKRNV